MNLAEWNEAGGGKYTAELKAGGFLPKKREVTYLTLADILEEITDEFESGFVTPLYIGKKLLENKINNEKNMNWIKAELKSLGIEIRVR